MGWSDRDTQLRRGNREVDDVDKMVPISGIAGARRATLSLDTRGESNVDAHSQY